MYKNSQKLVKNDETPSKMLKNRQNTINNVKKSSKMLKPSENLQKCHKTDKNL